MKITSLLIALSVLVPATFAQASGFNPRYGISSTVVGPFTIYFFDGSAYTQMQFSSLGPEPAKIILAAQDDAALFVATQGQVRGARLTQAIALLRSMLSADLSEMALAESLMTIDFQEISKN